LNNHTKESCKDLLRLSNPPSALSTTNKSPSSSKLPLTETAKKVSWASRLLANKSSPTALVADSDESSDDVQSDLKSLISVLAAIDEDPSSLSALMTSTPKSDHHYLHKLGTQASGASLSTW